MNVRPRNAKTNTPFLVAILLAHLAFGIRLSAATLYWDTLTGSWNSTSNWSTVSSGASGNNPAAFPMAGDTVVISATAIAGAPTVSLGANEACTGLVYGDGTTEGAGAINSGATSGYVLTIGTGGITTVANAGTLTINSNMGIALSGSQTWGGANTILFGGALTGAGNLYVNSLNVNTTTATAAVTGTLTVISGNSCDFSSSAFLNGFTGGVTLNASTTVGAGATLNITNNISFAGTTNWYTNSNTETFSGAVTGGPSGTGVFNVINGGLMTFSGATDNTNLSLVTSSGTTYLNKTSSATVHAVEKALTVNGTVQIIGSGGGQLGSLVTVTDNGTFDFYGDSETFASLTGAGTVTNTQASSTSTVTIGGNNSASSFSGVIQNGASGSGVVAVTKNGTGALTLSGVNTYTGATIINAGSLIADDSALNTTQSGTVTTASDLSANSTVTLSGATLEENGHTSANTINLTGTYANGQQITVPSTAGMTIGQLITGTGVPANTYITGIPNGTNVYISGLNPSLSGSSFALTFSALTYNNVDTVAGVILNAGSNSVVAALNSQGAVNTLGYDLLTLNAISRNTGATVNFTLPSGAQSTTNEITTTTADSNFTGGQQTILGGYATVGGTTWAVSAASGGSAGAISGLAAGAYNSGFAAGTDVEAGNATSTPGAMTINSLRFSTAGAATVNTAGNLVVANGGILEASSVGSNGVFINNNSITSGNGQDLIVIQNNTSTPMSIGSAITNNGGTSIGFTKSGAGTVTLNGANTYSGATTLNGGTTNVANSSTLGSGAGRVTLSGGSTLNFTNGGLAVVLPTSNASAWQSSSDWRNTPNNVNSTGSYQVGKNGGGTTTTGANGAQPDFVLINLGASYNLGQLQVTFANSYQQLQFYTAPSTYAFSSLFTANGHSAASPSTLNLGDFSVDSALFGTLGTDSSKTTQTFALSGVTGQYLAIYCTARVANMYGFDINTLSVTTALGTTPLAQSIGSLSSSDSTTTVNLSQFIVLNTGTDNTSTTYAGGIAGAGSLTKVGNGTFTLTGSNSYAGGTAINGGILNVGGTNALLGTASIGFGGGTLQYSAANQADYSGKILNSGSAISIDTNGQNVAFASVLAASNTGGLAKLGSGTLTLSASNNFSGATSLSAGTLDMANQYALQSSALTMSGGTLVFDQAVGGNAFTVAGLNAASSGAGYNIALQNNNASPAAITLTVNGGGTYAGVLSGAGALTKTGAGTQTLSGASSYTGATTVSGGTLLVSGSLSGTVSASVAAAATLEVDGSLNNAAAITVSGGLQGTGSVGAITANGGTLSAGLTAANSLTSSGVLTAAGAVTLSGSTNFNIRLGMLAGGTDCDQLAVTGNNTVSLNGANLQLTIGGYMNNATLVGTVYTIINDPGVAVSGTFSGPSSITANGWQFNILYDENAAGTGSGNDVDLVLTAVPEPGTWGMLFGGFGLLLGVQRIRRSLKPFSRPSIRQMGIKG